MKKIIALTMSLCLLFTIGCSKAKVKEEKENVIEEGEKTPPVNLIVSSTSEYFLNNECVDEENNADGYYKQTYKYKDVNFTFERMKHKDYSDFPVAVKDEKVSDLKKDDNIESKLSYPMRKVTYKTSIDKKDVFNEDVLISTDDWDFRVHLEISQDKYEKNKSIIDDIVKKLEVSEIN